MNYAELWLKTQGRRRKRILPITSKAMIHSTPRTETMETVIAHHVERDKELEALRLKPNGAFARFWNCMTLNF